MTLPMSRAIGDEGVAATSDGLRVELRLPWYRSLPLSTVEVEMVEIDGQKIAPESMCFELEDQRYVLADMAEQTTHVWYVLDSAWLTVSGQKLAPGAHDIAVTLTLYPPYIHGLKRPLRDTANFVIEPESAHV